QLYTGPDICRLASSLVMTTPLKQPHIERRIFQQRIWVAVLLVSLAFAALIARYFYLQVIQHTYYSQQAEKNRFKNSRIKATRGLIYDRNEIGRASCRERGESAV